MSILEESMSTWDKRFKARHYSYRDSLVIVTTVFTRAQCSLFVAQALIAGTAPPATIYYVFGANARNITTDPLNAVGNWPQAGDHAYAGNCYAREVKVTCDEDAWVRLVSVNPEYIRQAILKGVTNVVTTASPLLYEEEQFIPAGEQITFYPTYGYAIIFRANTISGTLVMWIEGNVEGAE